MGQHLSNLFISSFVLSFSLWLPPQMVWRVELGHSGRGDRYGAMAGHTVQTQVDLACQIICVCAVLASRNTHCAISWPFAHSPVWKGECGQKPAAREGVCVCVCVFAHICVRRGGSGGGGSQRWR